jgi:hypothetical protein
VPDGATVAVTITAPIRVPAKTAAVLEDLTSRLTFLYKFVFPTTWIGTRLTPIGKPAHAEG